MVANLAAGRPLMQGVDAAAAGPRSKSAHLFSMNGSNEVAAAASGYNLPLVLHYEGQGNGNKTYTCGPASTRNLVQMMTGTDYGEHQFEAWEGTSSVNGTAIGNIASTLNNHFGSYDTFAVTHPTSGALVLADAQTIVGEYSHEMVQNVLTNYLPFWGGHSAKHFDSVYGWSGSNVTIGEEWDPPAIGLPVSYGNPYGSHSLAATTDYTAIANSPTGQFVG
jgi:hypothetical protein